MIVNDSTLFKIHSLGVENGVTYPGLRLRQMYIEAVSCTDNMTHPLSAVPSTFKGIQNITIGAGSAENAVRSLSVLTANRFLDSTTVYVWIYVQSTFLVWIWAQGSGGLMTSFTSFRCLVFPFWRAESTRSSYSFFRLLLLGGMFSRRKPFEVHVMGQFYRPRDKVPLIIGYDTLSNVYNVHK